MKQLKKSKLICLSVFMIVLISGCSSLSDSFSDQQNGVFTSDGIPSMRYLVGGGIDITFIPSTPGTVHWVEETSQKIIQSKSLKADEKVEFSLETRDPDTYETLMGVELGESKYSLYFVPAADEALIPYR